MTHHPRLHAATLESPLGPLSVVASEFGLRAILWPGDEPERAGLHNALPRPGTTHVHRAVSLQLGEYFAGSRTSFDLPLDLEGTEFQLAAWRELTTIPYGETRTYAAQAARIGRPSAVRAVGAANGRNPISIVLPCHRVVGSNGSLTGFAGGIDAKRWLLGHERANAPSSSPARDRPVSGE
jgi:methylated-DNA-[protein]-cysteine S-methyltransferase